MSKKALSLAVKIILIASILIPAGLSMAQREGDRKFFAQTGHWVSGYFWENYRSTLNAEQVIGYPITDAYQSPTTGRTVQYFERAYYELLPDNPPELRVRLAPLGEILYKPGAKIEIQRNFPACKYFSETDHQVCYAFLDFFKLNGGITIFGYPISEIEIQDGRMVQYFQRARFEWHPELATGKVTLADLGRQYFEARKEDPARLLPNRDTYLRQSILGLKVRAFAGSAVMPQRGDQTVFVVVQDQNLLPLPGAQVSVIVLYPSGAQTSLELTPTNEHGITTINFPINEQVQGVVELQVTATYDQFKEKTRSSFRIWW